MKPFKGIFSILVVMLCVSCTDHIVYHAYRHFPKEGWAKSDTILLDLHITDSIASSAQITFLIRNKISYPYQDFNVVLLHNIPDSATWKSCNLNFILADKNGRWNGAGWGGLYQSFMPLGDVYITPGTYTFKVAHQMQDKNLLGINDIGILVEKEK